MQKGLLFLIKFAMLKIIGKRYKYKYPATLGGIDMHSDLDTVFELCREPMIAVRDGKITNLSPAARQLFSGIEVNQNISDYIPEDTLNTIKEGSFAASFSAELGERTLTASRSADSMILHISDDIENRPDFLSETLLSSMLSSLFNTGLAIERISSDTALSDKSLKYLSILNHSYYSLRHLIGNLHSISQLSEGTMNLSRSPANLALVCSELVSTLNALLSKNGVSLNYTTELGELYTNVDVEKIERVLSNLIANSYQHTESGGWINISLEKRDNRALITVRDSGSGIKPEVLQNVFRSYDEPLSSKSLSGDLRPGLGLAISRGIIALHGGTLIIDSSESEGTAIYISLPLDDNSAPLAFSDVTPPRNTSNMQLVLTEFCDILDSSYYTAAYLD